MRTHWKNKTVKLWLFGEETPLVARIISLETEAGEAFYKVKCDDFVYFIAVSSVSMIEPTKTVNKKACIRRIHP